MKRTKKNTIKNLVKENQRIHDYISPFGVKFWNKILKDSKAFSRNNKVFDMNLPVVIDRAYDRYEKALEVETDRVKRYQYEQFLFQLSYFMTEEWRDLFDENARLKENKRKIIWKERCTDEWNEYYIKLRKERQRKQKKRIGDKNEL